INNIGSLCRTNTIIRPASLVFTRSYHEKTIRKNLLQMLTLDVNTNVLANFFLKVIDHYERPRNVGSLPRTDPDVGTGLVGAPACGDVMKLQIRVDEQTGKIVDVKFKTFGCGSAIASSSYMTERVRGMSLDEASQIRNTEIAKELCLPPVKLHCSMLAEDAIKSAIKDYKTKRAST
ncbi:2254_t:CDS:2, partial [Racocetra persica]